MKKNAKLSLLFFLLIFSSQMYAGWVIKEKTTDGFGISSSQTTFIQDNKVRYESETSVAILNLNTKRVMMIFPQYKLYWAGSADEFKKNTIEAFDNHLQQLIVSAPEEDKEIYKKMYDDFKSQWNDKKNTKPIVKINATGKRDTILNYPVKEYQVVANDSLKEYIWVTKSINPYDEINFNKMVNFTQDLNPFDLEAEITASKAYTGLISKGMVLKSVELHKKIHVVTEVTMVKHVDFNNDIFNAPFGYRKADISEILQMSPQEQNLNPNELPNSNKFENGIK